MFRQDAEIMPCAGVDLVDRVTEQGRKDPGRSHG